MKIATGEIEESGQTEDGRSKAAVELGRKGGSPERRSCRLNGAQALRKRPLAPDTAGSARSTPPTTSSRPSKRPSMDRLVFLRASVRQPSCIQTRGRIRCRRRVTFGTAGRSAIRHTCGACGRHSTGGSGQLVDRACGVGLASTAITQPTFPREYEDEADGAAINIF